VWCWDGQEAESRPSSSLRGVPAAGRYTPLAMLAGLRSVDKFYGAQDVLSGVDFSVQPGDRVALVGRNGAGKSTVLRLLAGLEEANGGQILRTSGLSVRMLAQDPEFEPGGTVLSAVEAAFTELDALESEMRALEGSLAAHASEESLTRYHELEEHYRLRGGYERASRRDTVLAALGFTGRVNDPLKGLSGGERTRLALAQILVAQPELLLLDEPTNHLDIVMVEWLESFLRSYPGALVIVSHDRAFLDAVATETALVTRAKLRVYPGNYSAFREARDQELTIQAATFHNEKRELDRLEAMTTQMKIWGQRNEKLAIRARSMEKRVERFEASMVEEPPPAERTTRVRFAAPDSGETVLIASHLSKAYGGRALFTDLDFTVRRGERIALVGRNGAGKSTLVRVLLGLLPSDDARSFTRLGARVKLGYYDQQLRGVDPTNTLYEEVRSLVETDQGAHDLLGNYLFPFDAQFKKVADLSGGERARLALLKLSLEDCNFLVLDEPTNHLDMEMVESLEAGLKAFTGTIVLVSHDRRFIEGVSNQIWLLEDGQFFSYPGGWAYYREKHKSSQLAAVAGQDNRAMPAPKSAPASAKAKAANPWKLRQRKDELETRIAALEAEMAAITAELGAPTASTDFAALGKRGGEAEAELDGAMNEWEKVASALEELGHA
jgi:ATP-binding cassette subfamily F protein 3